MAIGDTAFEYNDIDTAMSEIYRLNPAKAQFTRVGNTAKHFNPKGQVFKGTRWHMKAYTAPPSGARSTTMANGATSSFPASRDTTYLDLSYGYTDLSMIRGSVRINEIADIRSADRATAVFQVANKLINEADSDFAKKINDCIHMPTTGKMAAVSAKYKVDGDTYPGGSATAAFLKIKEGVSSRFMPGMVIGIRTAATATIRATVTVNDVVHGKNGPPATSIVSDIGPGIRVTVNAASGDADAHLDNVAANDELVLSGEGLTDNFSGFSDWWNQSVVVYKDLDGGSLARTTTGNAWMLPEKFTIAAAGSEVAFDPDVHLGQVADVLPHRIGTARMARLDSGDPEEVQIAESLLMVMPVDVANEAVRSAIDTQRFTHTTMMNLSEARKTQLFGRGGFDGYVWNSMTLGSVAVQPDPVAEPYTVTVIEPNSWFFLNLGGTQNRTVWLDNGGGSKFRRIQASTGESTFYREANYWTATKLVCDQPGANFRITGVKSSL